MTEADDLYIKAVRVVAESQKASTSYVQRHLRIGYNSAARLIERMEKEGKVGHPDHVGRREVLMVPGVTAGFDHTTDDRFAGWDPAAEARAAKEAVAHRARSDLDGPVPTFRKRSTEELAADMVATFGAEEASALVDAIRAVDALDADDVTPVREPLDETSVAHLTQIVERAEKLMEERDDLNTTIRELFAFAKSIGFDPRAIRARIKERALDKITRHEREATDEIYRHALRIDGPDFMIPLPRAAVDPPPMRKKITAKEKQARDQLMLIAADRATSLN